MVRLRAMSQDNLSILQQFQFQYGAIESRKLYVCRSTSSLFQFQYGAIESKIVSCYEIGRLRFNSNMVRLRDEIKADNGNIKTTFQFQYGAIESRKRWAFCISQRSFNSNMVRLREYRMLSILYLQQRFNSNMVRLRDWKSY